MKILLAGYFGYGNPGDEFTYKVADTLLGKNHQLTVLVSKNVKSKNKKYLRRGVFRNILSIAQCDVVLFPGGSIFQDISGNGLTPLYYGSLILWGRLLGKKVYLCSQGIGPLLNPFNRWFVKRVLALANYISLRDTLAEDYFKQNGIEYNFVGADVVWLLLDRNDSAKKETERTVIFGNDVYKYQVTKIIDTISQSSQLVTSRYHLLLLGALLGCDLVAISRDPKVVALAHALRIPCHEEYSSNLVAKSPSNIDYLRKRAKALAIDLVRNLQ